MVVQVVFHLIHLRAVQVYLLLQAFNRFPNWSDSVLKLGWLSFLLLRAPDELKKNLANSMVTRMLKDEFMRRKMKESIEEIGGIIAKYQPDSDNFDQSDKTSSGAEISENLEPNGFGTTEIETNSFSNKIALAAFRFGVLF